MENQWFLPGTLGNVPGQTVDVSCFFLKVYRDDNHETMRYPPSKLTELWKMAIYSGIYPFNMVIFHSDVKLPEDESH